MAATDTLGRPLRDLRISVTDRCNFRCVYCIPKEVFGRDYRFLDRRELLSFEEIDRLARAFVAHGVEKIRMTGGEPLIRRDLERLVEKLSAIGGLGRWPQPGALRARRDRRRTPARRPDPRRGADGHGPAPPRRGGRDRAGLAWRSSRPWPKERLGRGRLDA